VPETEVDFSGFCSDDWCTPTEVVEVLVAFGGVALDPCSNRWSIIPAARSYHLRRGEDGLLLPWTGPGGGLTYVNPPYSEPAPWMKKAAEGTGEVVLLVNYDATKAWRLYGFTADAITFVDHRIKFIGDKKFTARGAAAFIYWGTRPEEWDRVASVLGKTWVRP